MSRDDPHFRLRVPADLKDQIEASAKRNKRSINAEIGSMLEAALGFEAERESYRRERAEQESKYRNLEKERDAQEELLRYMESLTGKYEKSFQRLSDALEDRGVEFPVLLYEDEFVNHADAIARLATLATVIEEGDATSILRVLGISTDTLERIQAAVRVIENSVGRAHEEIKGILPPKDDERPR